MISELRMEDGGMYMVDSEGNEHEISPKVDVSVNDYMKWSEPTTYEPYEPVGKNLFDELKIDDSGMIITCEGLRSCGKSLMESCMNTIDLGTMRYCVEDIENTNKYLEEKEGENMKILNMYVEKSEKNIKEYYDKLLDEEYDNREVVKEFKTLCDKFQEDLAKLAEKTANDECKLVELDWEDFEPAYGIECNPTEEEQEIKEKLSEELRNLHDKVDEVNAQLEIITNDENSSHHDVNYVLHNYGIIDDNNKLTPYTPVENKKAKK